MANATPTRWLSEDEFEELGRKTAKYKFSRSQKVRLRRFKSHFGVPPDVVSCTWELLLEHDFLKNNMPGLKSPNPEHMLWALMMLKRHSTMPVLASNLKVDENTLRKWGFLYLEAMAELDRDVVSGMKRMWLLWLFHKVAFVFGCCLCHLTYD